MASSIFFFFLPLFCLICSTFMVSKSHNSINSINGGFTMPLVHRDSPQSPFYNHSMNIYERRIASARRSISRLKHLSLRAKATPQSDSPDFSSKLIYDNLEYVVSYYIGTPGSKVDAFIDTATDITWTKALPIFNSSSSSSYRNISCLSPVCVNLGEFRTCESFDDGCTYDIEYLDGSTSRGILARDKFLFDASSDGSNNNVVDVGFIYFGCNDKSSAHFIGNQNGILALARGSYSLISQLGLRKFSHCFVKPDDEGSGRMYFGSKAVIYDSGLTPLVDNKNSLYYVNLEGISIGGTEVEIPSRTFYGGIVVDAGASHTMLASAAYDPLLIMLRLFVHKPIIIDPEGEYELCFDGTYDDVASIPLVTFHFPGLDLNLTHDVTFLDFGDGLWCLAILRSINLQSTIGNIQMRNLLVGYDLDKNGISFTHADCRTF